MIPVDFFINITNEFDFESVVYEKDKDTLYFVFNGNLTEDEVVHITKLFLDCERYEIDKEKLDWVYNILTEQTIIKMW